MKERPIIFNDEMVRAIISGAKSMTRRPMKGVMPDNGLWLKKPTKTRSGITTHVMDAPKHGLCPFGHPGDHLWVREAYQGPLLDYDQMEEYCEYRADRGSCPEYYDCDDNLRHGWSPSIHMPRWASRITLEITDVRVERLQDITEEEAKAEGATPAMYPITPSETPYRDGFGDIWRSIYGDDSWDANPWVWVIAFKRVDTGCAAGASKGE
ncbi:hypothetical protein [Edwardsiella anguillarum]|uniref:Morphogenetic protein n=1 Tax=Edwardsiella anguillarum TaxID=1821960 RepID=A0ABY8SMS6_9GAMM|nr:hypothetical protein [Edwardsiella anguillarum]WHP85168.1 hypothetical protein MQ095_07035 [Edwardsiella anguillarum]WHP88951.1 hypothetical protein MQ088_07040 [Edwardsiella anguillarum]WHP92750.1 hypothetical protein MQ091_07035 [Edwardsiella anguillarum]WHP96555.1 hypothetical protein MQ096_07030 [Edwardsiella anguillarum]WHQ00426.1 hypothetical protein MQ082_07035 [Edwardsiella anguillarum]